MKLGKVLIYYEVLQIKLLVQVVIILINLMILEFFFHTFFFFFFKIISSALIIIKFYLILLSNIQVSKSFKGHNYEKSLCINKTELERFFFFDHFVIKEVKGIMIDSISLFY